MQKLLRLIVLFVAFAMTPTLSSAQTSMDNPPEYQLGVGEYNTEAEARAAIASLTRKGGVEAAIAQSIAHATWMNLLSMPKHFVVPLLMIGKGEYTRDPIFDPDTGKHFVILVFDKRGVDNVRDRLHRERKEDFKDLIPGYSKLSIADKAEFNRRAEIALPHPEAHTVSRCGANALNFDDVDLSSDEKIRVATANIKNSRGCLHEFYMLFEMLPNTYLSALDHHQLPKERVTAINKAWMGLRSLRVRQFEAIRSGIEMSEVYKLALRLEELAHNKRRDANEKWEAEEKQRKISKEVDLRQFNRCVDTAGSLETDLKELNRSRESRYTPSGNGWRLQRLEGEYNKKAKAFDRDCHNRNFTSDPKTMVGICRHPATHDSNFCDQVLRDLAE